MCFRFWITHTYVFCVYIPPVGDDNLYNNLVQCISAISMDICDNDEVMVFGDFNLPSINWIDADDGDFMIPLNVSVESSFFDGICHRLVCVSLILLKIIMADCLI